MIAVVDLARPEVKVIARWPGHGDLTILVRDGVVYVRADQLEQLAGIPPWSSGETLLEDVWPLEVDGKPFDVLDVAVARCEASDTEAASAFLHWLRETVEDLLVDEQLDRAQRVPGFIGSYPVKVAARLLDQDPTIRIGPKLLFAHMHELGWISRTSTGEWALADVARRHGWLTTRPVPRTWRGAPAHPYPQPYVTPLGLAELHRTLAGVSPPHEQEDAPTLFD